MSALAVLKDVSLCVGIVGFTFWQWTNPRNYKFKRRLLCGLKVPYWQIWVFLYACLAVSWITLLLTATASMQYLIPNTVLMIAGLVLNKVWTLLAADAVAAYPGSTLVFNVLALLTLVLMIALHVAYLVLTALDGAWWSFGVSLLYPIWLMLAIKLSLPLRKALIHLPTLYKSEIASDNESDNDADLMVTPSLFTGKRVASGLRNTHLL